MVAGIQIIDPEERFRVEIDGAGLFIRRIDSAALMAIERRRQGEGNRQAINDDVLDYVLLDWEGVSSPLGDSQVPCTRENKLRLPTSVKLKVLAAAQMPRAQLGEV
ncbi:hypothetical protein AAU61_06425 [Desulfocarbo indianensis]|nr:hypothetical protein AAU61_06425 [Desulfocarbo indianensis]